MLWLAVLAAWGRFEAFLGAVVPLMPLLGECVSAERAAEVMQRGCQDTPTLGQLGRIAFRSQVEFPVFLCGDTRHCTRLLCLPVCAAGFASLLCRELPQGGWPTKVGRWCSGMWRRRQAPALVSALLQIPRQPHMTFFVRLESLQLCRCCCASRCASGCRRRCCRSHTPLGRAPPPLTPGPPPAPLRSRWRGPRRQPPTWSRRYLFAGLLASWQSGWT